MRIKKSVSIAVLQEKKTILIWPQKWKYLTLHLKKKWQIYGKVRGFPIFTVFIWSNSGIYGNFNLP